MVYPCFFEMALHGGGHLELKKMHKGDFWGIFGIRLGRCPCIILEKISFLQFYSRFNPNALALLASTLLVHTYLNFYSCISRVKNACIWYNTNPGMRSLFFLT